jgi:hypothetical protein
MLLPQPEFLSKLHVSVLEIEGIAFNILIFCEFVLDHILNMIRRVKERDKK